MVACSSQSPVAKRSTPTSVDNSIQRKYQRIRERPSSLSETVRRKLIAKATGSSDIGPEISGDLGPETSDLGPATSDLAPETSDLGPVELTPAVPLRLVQPALSDGQSGT